MGPQQGTEQTPHALTVGTVIDGRFQIERSVSSGGMATVHLAIDQTTGQKVALKLLKGHAGAGLEATRLRLESQLLAELHHPRIVSYIGHGQTVDGFPYLAIEWLEGEDMAQRLLRGPMRMDETLTLLEGVAEALSVAHSRGIIHRDIKPSNLFLRSKLVGQVTLLDFGIARNQERGLLLTHTGALVGTPGYMAPEQAKGVRELEPSVDIFALGCILYECLTGAPPFVAMHFSALLALILYQEVPSVRSIRPEVPEALSELIASMLSKEPRLRPANGTQLLAELEKLRAVTSSSPSLTTEVPRPLLRQIEDPLIGVVVSSQRRPRILSSETMDYSEADPGFVASQQELSSLLRQVGAQVERLADETLVASLRLEATATEQLTEVLSHIQQVRDVWPTGLVVVTVSQADATGQAPLGFLLERVSQLFDALVTRESEAQTDSGELWGVFVDDGIASLLGSPFDLERLHARLFRLHSDGTSARTPQGTAFQSRQLWGRERELGLLHATLRDCQEESLARAVLITGREGIGKSRLLSEFVSQTNALFPNVTVLSMRTPRQESTSLAPLLGGALRRLCEISPSEGGHSAMEKLHKRLLLRMPAPLVQQVLAPLCAICSITPSIFSTVESEDRPSFDLSELSQAFLRFLSAELAASPVLFAFDDLEAADAPSIKLMERTLDELADRPIFAVGVANPSISSRFPRLWEQSKTETLRLHPLSLQTSEQLATDLAKGPLSSAQKEKIVRLSQGHPRTLQELLLWELDPNRDKFPYSLGARILIDSLRLPRDARRVLRAASMIGPVFWDEALRMLLDEPQSSGKVERALAVLQEQEWIVPQRSSHYPGYLEYRFRQLIVHECFTTLMHPEEREFAKERMKGFVAQANNAG